MCTHGGKNQQQRDYVMNKFRQNNDMNILVASDVASRGLDIPDIGVVINYDFPINIEVYVHRVGRTARGTKTGVSYSFFTKDDILNLKPLLKVRISLDRGSSSS